MLYLLLPLDCWGGFLITSYHFPILNASVRFLGFCAWWTHGCLALGYKWVALRWTHEAGKLCPVDALAIVMCFTWHRALFWVWLAAMHVEAKCCPLGWLNLNYSLPQSCEFRLMWEKAIWCSPTLPCKWECVTSAHSIGKFWYLVSLWHPLQFHISDVRRALP